MEVNDSPILKRVNTIATDDLAKQGATTSSLIVFTYRKTSNVSGTSVDHKIVDHSDVTGAPPVGAAPTTSSFST